MTNYLATDLAKRSERDRLLLLAREGDEEVQSLFADRLNLYVFTNEEVKGVNYYLNERRGMGDIVRLEKDVFLEVPVGISRSETRLSKINWLMDIGQGYFRAGMTIQGDYSGDPWDGAEKVWCLQLDPTKGFVPLFDTSSWDEKEGEFILKQRIKYNQNGGEDNE